MSSSSNLRKSNQQLYTKDETQRPITIDLIRKRSEHNSNLISDLEEIALHQEELTSIGTTLGKVCGKTLRILLLQNNVIGNLHSFEMKYFKVLEYMNLALNNLTTVRGLDGLVNEHLSKLDLTLNFIDFDSLKESMECLATLRNLKELYMMGNPCCLGRKEDEKIDDNGIDDDRAGTSQFELLDTDSESETEDRLSSQEDEKGWKNFRLYVISKLPILESLDGKVILRSERIKAMQMKSTVEEELNKLSSQCKIRKAEEKKLEALQSRLNDASISSGHDRNSDNSYQDQSSTKHCPKDRMILSNEMAMQKAEREENEKANQPKLKTEKDFEEDQRKAIENARQREERGDIKQCNGKFETFPTNALLTSSKMQLAVRIETQNH